MLIYPTLVSSSRNHKRKKGSIFNSWLYVQQCVRSSYVAARQLCQRVLLSHFDHMNHLYTMVINTVQAHVRIYRAIYPARIHIICYYCVYVCIISSSAYNFIYRTRCAYEHAMRYAGVYVLYVHDFLQMTITSCTQRIDMTCIHIMHDIDTAGHGTMQPIAMAWRQHA